ncbi:glucans biosynthesis glucosyltransferase MdoH [Posidoniimonas corsicana]|uniref:glucans biosynthesis glucosyltransferase MdoH n=1 Tax=Posidoniimonas corsicana TaxID=1938618 RepID=UPI0011B63D21|nr:glucans biosynthesis glucosyltransferase MdoH [Posidoniimonas corsicana]
MDTSADPSTGWRCGAVLAATAVMAATLTAVFWRLITPHSVDLADVMVAGIFFGLTSWMLLWTVIATIGAVLLLREPSVQPAHTDDTNVPPGQPATRTAVLLPTYNEDPRLVFSGLRAMIGSLAQTGQADRFDFFVLSDSTDPAVWLEEERRLRLLTNELDGAPHVYYRHRTQNVGKKAGNIADFCRRWGGAYDYMLVLDADSLIEGSLFVEMARRMDADPKLGILQTPPLPLGSESVLSRCQQFVCRLCGPALTRGLSYVVADGGNYWGHNAIIRTRAFVEHCGLPDLPGAPPLGGQILSHDFVEAALIRRAGYKVQLAWDLLGGYEQSPNTLPEYAVRDRRWCQGNLQHARLVVSRDIPFTSRVHFAAGVACYGSSPVWLAFLLLSPLAFLDGAAAGLVGGVGLGLFAFVMGLLILPRLYGLTLAVRDRQTLRGFGGFGRLLASTVIEFLISMLAAPILMAFHTVFVITTLTGACVGWSTQCRDTAGVTWREATLVHWRQTAVGLAAAALAAFVSPALLLWLSPILLGLVLSIPLSVAISSSRLGRLVRRTGLLQSPEEALPPPIVTRFRDCLAAAKRIDQDCTPRFRDFLRDGRQIQDHILALHATRSIQAAPAQSVKRMVAWARSGADGEPDVDDQRALLSDPAALRGVHRSLWVYGDHAAGLSQN